MRAAVLFRGYAHREKGGIREYGTDWKLCVASHHSMILGPLSRQYEVETFLSTYWTPRIASVKSDYHPMSVVLNLETNVQPQTMVAGLKLIEEHGPFDLVVVIRFDLELRRVPIYLPGFNPDKVNFLWREENLHRWERDREVADAIYMLHGRYLNGFRRGMENVAIRSDGWMHDAYKPVVAEVGEENVVVMDENCVCSNTDMMPNYLYRIMRVWP